MPHIYRSPQGPIQGMFVGNAAEFIQSSPMVKANPDGPVYIDAKTGKKLTARQAVDMIQAMAYVLRTDLNVQYDDVVCIFMKNTIYTPPLHFGILSNGAVVSPANIAYLPEELAHQLRVSRAKVVVTMPEFKDRVEKALKEEGVVVERVILIDDLVSKVENTTGRDLPVKLPGGLAREKDAYYCFSSGTSGLPKGVMTTHTNITSNCQQQYQSSFGFYKEGNVYGAVLPMSHIFGLAKFVYLTFYTCCTLVVFPQFELEPLLQAIIKYRITHLHVVPPIVVLLAKSPVVDKYMDITKSLRGVMSGAAPLSQSLIDQVEARLPPISIKQGYGLTESSPVSHFFMYKNTYNKSSIGWLVPGQEARIVDDEENDVPKGERGELWIRGPNIMRGYLRNPEATAETLTPDGFLRTGDIAMIDEDDQFYIMDRKKELIKSKGHQVAPAELEAILLKHPEVIDCAVTGAFSEEEQSELPRGYVVLRNPSEKVALEVKQWFDESVSRHKRLWGGICIIDAVPKNASGKLLRRNLRTNSKNDKPLGMKTAKL